MPDSDRVIQAEVDPKSIPIAVALLGKARSGRASFSSIQGYVQEFC